MSADSTRSTLKFNAFPFQRHGFIEGILEYIAPDAVASSNDDVNNPVPVYRGRIGLERLHFQVGDRQVPLRYGMAATAELVVRERRLIDFALDPFGGFTG